MRYALVLAQDLSADGTQLGPRTIMRLEAALKYCEENDARPVVAAGVSPNHPQQRRSMREMMWEWFIEHGRSDVFVTSDPPMFNTLGELMALYNDHSEWFSNGTLSIVSAPWHLRRVKLLIRILNSRNENLTFTPVKVEGNKMSPWDVLLEPLKLAYWWSMRFRSHKEIVSKWKKRKKSTLKIGINTSY